MSNAVVAVSREALGMSVQRRVALVVEVDYFAMSSRFDPNVIFWNAGFAKDGVPTIPSEVTHLWVSKHTNEQHRQNILEQAKERDIIVWDCAIYELRRRLLGFWTVPNQSLINPVMPEEDPAEALEGSLMNLGSTDDPDSFKVSNIGRYQSPIWETAMLAFDGEPEAVDRKGEDEDAIPKIPLRKKARESARLKAIRQAHARAKRKARQVNGIQKTIKTASVSDVLGESLAVLSGIERLVFVWHYEQKEVDVQATAKHFGLPLGNVPRVLQRAWTRLGESGCSCTEALLQSKLSA